MIKRYYKPYLYVYNVRYKEKITELAETIEDTPMSPLETAVWWTEYVLRHKDLSHLKGAAVHANLNEYYMIDVILFLVFIFTLILCASLWTLQITYKIIINTYKNAIHRNKVKKH